ncbi:MAG: hypothetical protein AB7F41_02805 [Methylocystis sp.]|uniref:hypothetical protein n=1 Tax=Methylocystis sp. TaxID=1911079 RepID=UPI003D0A5CAB
MNRFLRNYSLILGGAQGLYWLYTFRLIYVNTNWMGDGMEWVAVMPFGFIFFGLVSPALVMSKDGRWLKLAAVLVTVAVVLNVLLFLEIAGELTGGNSRALNL